MPSKRRYVVFGLLAFAIVLGLTLGHGFAWLLGRLGIANTPLFGLRELELSHASGFVVSVAVALGLGRYAKSRQLIDEIADEMTRVTWPSRDEISHATVVVVVCVVVCSLFLGLFDAAWMWVTGRMLGLDGA